MVRRGQAIRQMNRIRRQDRQIRRQHRRHMMRLLGNVYGGELNFSRGLNFLLPTENGAQFLQFFRLKTNKWFSKQLLCLQQVAVISTFPQLLEMSRAMLSLTLEKTSQVQRKLDILLDFMRTAGLARQVKVYLHYFHSKLMILKNEWTSRMQQFQGRIYALYNENSRDQA